MDFGLVVQSVQNSSVPLRPGDVIIALDNRRFGSLRDFKQQIDKAEAGTPVALLVRRGDANLYVAVPVGKATG